MTHLGTDASNEIDPQILQRDITSPFTRFTRSVMEPVNLGFAQMGLFAWAFVYPFCIPLIVPIQLYLLLSHKSFLQKRQLPMKMPKWMAKEGVLDPMESGQDNKPKPPEGILLLGNKRTDIFKGKNEEVWASDGDARAHLHLASTTGGGKTERLLSHCYNALCWSSGFVFVDGKAVNSFFHQTWAMCRRCGVEDNLVVLNFMQGGKDGFTLDATTRRLSNTMNPFAMGSTDFISNLLASLMKEAEGESGTWREKAIGMLDAVVRPLAWLRYRGELLIDPGVLREYISLPKMRELAERDDFPDEIIQPLRSYLGRFTDENEASNQHGYLESQFGKVLGSLNDTYGPIAKCQLSEIDPLDIVLNNRILICLIPSLEKSEIEAQGLGRLVVSSLRLMMAVTLGSQLDGTYEDVVESKMTASDSPYQFVFDELGYYFTGHNEALIGAQARGCGISMMTAWQDKQAACASGNEKRVQTIIANAGIKECGKLEDPGDTFDDFVKSAGEAIVAQQGESSGRVGVVSTHYSDSLRASFEKRTRLTVQELKNQKAGQAVILYKATITRINYFYLFGSLKINKKRHIGLNQFVQSPDPSIKQLKELNLIKPYIPPATKKNRSKIVFKVAEHLKKGQPLAVTEPVSVIGSHLQQASVELDEINRKEIEDRNEPLDPINAGIFLYERVRHGYYNLPMPQNEDEGDVVLNFGSMGDMNPVISCMRITPGDGGGKTCHFTEEAKLSLVQSEIALGNRKAEESVLRTQTQINTHLRYTRDDVRKKEEVENMISQVMNFKPAQGRG